MMWVLKRRTEQVAKVVGEEKMRDEERKKQSPKDMRIDFIEAGNFGTFLSTLPVNICSSSSNDSNDSNDATERPSWPRW